MFTYFGVTWNISCKQNTASKIVIGVWAGFSCKGLALSENSINRCMNIAFFVGYRKTSKANLTILY